METTALDYQLKWSEHTTNLNNSIASLYRFVWMLLFFCNIFQGFLILIIPLFFRKKLIDFRNNKYADVMLITSDHQVIPCHKLVLSSTSAVSV